MLTIAPDGKVAAYTTAACCALGGVAIAVLAAPRAACDTPACQDAAAGAWLLLLFAVCILVLAAAIAIMTRRRPVGVDGTTGWCWGMGAAVAACGLVLAVLVPASTCPQGGAPDLTLELCLDGRERLPMTSWVWLERSIVVAGLGLGLAVALVRRWIWLTAACTVALCGGTVTWAIVRHA